MFPKNRRASFRTDDRVVSVFHHDHPVGDADAESPARAALAEDDGDDRHLEQHHFAEVESDGFGDVALFRADAGEGTRSVDHRDDRQAEFFGDFHQTQGFAVAFGMGAAEVALEVFLGVAALLVADNDHALTADARESAGHRRVVADVAIPVEFAEIRESEGDVVEHERTVRVTGDLDSLPRG